MPAVGLAPPKKTSGQLPLAPEAAEDVVTWKGQVDPPPQPEVTRYWKATKLAYESGEALKGVIVTVGALQGVRWEASLAQGVTPPGPVLAEPIELADARLLREAIATKGTPPFSLAVRRISSRISCLFIAPQMLPNDQAHRRAVCGASVCGARLGAHNHRFSQIMLDRIL